jgi:hypothetical protein
VCPGAIADPAARAAICAVFCRIYIVRPRAGQQRCGVANTRSIAPRCARACAQARGRFGGPGRNASSQTHQWLTLRCGRFRLFEWKKEFCALPAPAVTPRSTESQPNIIGAFILPLKGSGSEGLAQRSNNGRAICIANGPSWEIALAAGLLLATRKTRRRSPGTSPIVHWQTRVPSGLLSLPLPTGAPPKTLKPRPFDGAFL